MKKDYIEIGIVVAPHGIKGEVRIYPLSDNQEVLLGYKEVLLDDGRKLKVESARVHKNIVVFKFTGFNNRNDIPDLLNKKISVKRASIKLPKNRVFIEDLIGLKVYDADDDRYYGKISEVTSGAGNDIYVVTNDEQTHLIPAVSDFVIKIDLRNKKVLIRLIEGLLEI